MTRNRNKGNNYTSQKFIKENFVNIKFIVIFITLLSGFYLLDGKIDRQSARTDKLYEMFIDLLKNRK
jgi:hypothetical protein